MARLRADKKNYKKAFHTHYQACKNWDAGCHNSRKLLMCYCVENGLKWLIMEENRLERISQADDRVTKVLGSHDFRMLLREVKKAGIYRFRDFQTEYGDCVTAENYHQMCRYCVGSKGQDMRPVEEYDKTLHAIAEWLLEVI